VGAHLVKDCGDVALLVVTERGARRLLAVSERRVENSYTVNFAGAG
jgi:hypothetical protein